MADETTAPAGEPSSTSTQSRARGRAPSPAAPAPAPSVLLPADERTIQLGNLTIYADSAAHRASLFAKLSRVLAQIERVEKSGNNTEFKYRYATEADTLDEVRPLLAKEGLAVTVTVDEVNFVEGTTGRGNQKWLCRAWFAFALLDGETGAVMVVRWLGEGTDTQDKAFYKAASGATKYFAFKNFLISTGDDPERDERRRGGDEDEHGPALDDDHIETVRAIEALIPKLPRAEAGVLGGRRFKDARSFLEANRRTWYNNPHRAREVAEWIDAQLAEVQRRAAEGAPATPPDHGRPAGMDRRSLAEESTARPAADPRQAPQGGDAAAPSVSEEHRKTLWHINELFGTLPKGEPVALTLDGLRVEDTRAHVRKIWSDLQGDAEAADAFLATLRRAMQARETGENPPPPPASEPAPAPQEGGQSAGAGDVPKITPAQVGRFWTVARGAGFNDDGAHLMLSKLFGLTSSKEIPAARFNDVLAVARDEAAAQRWNKEADNDELPF